MVISISNLLYIYWYAGPFHQLLTVFQNTIKKTAFCNVHLSEWVFNETKPSNIFILLHYKSYIRLHPVTRTMSKRQYSSCGTCLGMSDVSERSSENYIYECFKSSVFHASGNTYMLSFRKSHEENSHAVMVTKTEENVSLFQRQFPFSNSLQHLCIQQNYFFQNIYETHVGLK